MQEPVCRDVIFKPQRSQIAPLLVTSEMIGNDDPCDAATVQAMDESASNEAGRSGHQIAALRNEKSRGDDVRVVLARRRGEVFEAFIIKCLCRENHCGACRARGVRMPNFRAESRLGRSASVELFPGSLTSDWSILGGRKLGELKKTKNALC